MSKKEALPQTIPDKAITVSFRNLYFNQTQNIENFIYVSV